MGKVPFIWHVCMAERKRNFVDQHLFARGYFVSTVGRGEQVIRNYIRHQEQEDERLKQLSRLLKYWLDGQKSSPFRAMSPLAC